MKIAIISSHSSLNTADLVRAASQLSDVQCDVYALKELAFAVDTIETHPFFEYDVYLFRGYNRRYSFAQSLAQSLVRRGKMVIDRTLTSGFIPSKFHEALTYKDASVAHIPTYSARQFDALANVSFDGEYPVVVKDIDSQRGRGVRLARNEEELRIEIEEHGDEIIIQKFMTIDYDIRVLCIGDRILGAMKRASSGADFRTNVSLGGSVSPYTLTDQERTLALKAHRAMGYDISGVDIAHDATEQPVIIETNITPEWQGFKQATGIDVAEAIISYIRERYNHEHTV